MRIIGGEARGRRLCTPGRSSARPTSDRIKEALFNIVREMNGKTFLDLFAGTGSVGLEALSRGAARAVFVENNRSMLEIVKKNILLCGYADRSEVLGVDFQPAIEKLAGRRDMFDMVFADPPYGKGFVERTLECLRDGLLVAQDGLLVIQHSSREEIEGPETGCLIPADRRQYGDTVLSFFRK